MMETLIYLLVLLGAVATGLAILWSPRRDRHTTARTEAAPLYFGLFGTGCWALVAYGASSIDVIDKQQGEVIAGATAEPALVVLGVGLLLISLLATVAAATESFPQEAASDIGSGRFNP